MTRGASVEEKAANILVGMVSYIDHNVNLFAAVLSQHSARVQHGILDAFMAFVDHLSLMWDEELYADDDTKDLCIRAKRMQDAMIHFR